MLSNWIPHTQSTRESQFRAADTAESFDRENDDITDLPDYLTDYTFTFTQHNSEHSDLIQKIRRKECTVWLKF